MSGSKLLPILAIETSNDLCGAALMIDENYIIDYSIRLKQAQSEKIISSIDTVLSEAEITVNDINHIAVSMGPGSFTGLRIGLSAAKGIALGAGLPIAPVPTFDAYAYALSRLLTGGEVFFVAVKVNRDEIYIKKYYAGEEFDPNSERIKIISKNDLEEFTAGNELIYGNAGRKNFSLSAEIIARWSYIFGKDSLTLNFDYLEPDYHKKFIPKVKK